MSARSALWRSASVFAALGDRTRLALVERLCEEGPSSISHLCRGVAMTRQGITKHLEILADAGLLDDRRRGRERIWQIREDRIEEARRCLDRISRQWDEALGRLREFVERKP